MASFGRTLLGQLSRAARHATSSPLSGASEAVNPAGRVTRSFRKSLMRNFPGEDVISILNNHNSIQCRCLTRSASKTTPVATGLKQVNDETDVDPELVTKFVVRPARAADCTDIMRLIQDLAEWEGNTDQVEITEEDLIRDGFGENPQYKCILLEAHCEHDDVRSVIGYGIFSFGYCAWKGRGVTWEDLFIHRDYRGKGLGAVLLHEACKFGYMEGCNYIGGYVNFANERAKQMYEDCGFENQTERYGYNIMSMDGAPLANYVRNHSPLEKLARRGVHVELQVTP